MSSGHIPASLPVPFTSYLATDQPYTTYKSPKELQDVLVQGVGGEAQWEKVKGGKGVVFTCGSGMTAAVGWLANQIITEQLGTGAPNTAIYDEVSLNLQS
jgi:thiosulfate/3-mercaptopyruvate sulfurtransferase